jgi:uncharacterized protein (TIGR00297 family)
MHAVYGFFGATVIALVAWRFHALTMSGAVAAIFVGGTIVAGGEVSAAILLLAFFLSGSVLSRLNGKHAGARDWKQVLANGLFPAIAMLVMYLKPDTREQATLFFLGAIATAAADTWATELGTRFGGRVIDILTLRTLQRGLSGGITAVGLIASALGAFLIGALALIHPQEAVGLCHELFTPVLPVVTVAGFCGALLDSIIGSRLQTKYLLIDGSVIETYITGAEHASGLRWIDNNVTNLLATLIGGLLAVGFAGWF